MMRKRIDFGYMHQNPPSDGNSAWPLIILKDFLRQHAGCSLLSTAVAEEWHYD